MAMWALKDRVMQALEEVNGDYITINDLAQRFNVSRTAIRNVCLSAANRGLPVEFVKMKGFRLIPQDKILTEDIINQHLQTKEFGRMLTIVEEAAYMNRLLFQPQSQMRHGAVLLVRERVLLSIEGKHTPCGGIYMSVLLCRDSTPDKWIKQQKAALEAVQKTMKDGFDISLHIDGNRFVASQRIVGWVQTHAVRSGNRMGASCISIYLYSDISGDCSAEHQMHITDLTTLAGHRLSRAEVVAKLLNGLETVLEKIGHPTFTGK